MKILLATYWTLPHTGGLSGYVYQLKEELERLGHEVDVFGHHPSYLHYHMPNLNRFIEKQQIWDVVSEKMGNFHNQYYPELDPWIKQMEMERYSFELAAAFCKLHNYDLIHTQDIVATLALSRVKPKHIPLVATIHGCFTKEFLLYGMIKQVGDITWQYSILQEYLGTRSSRIAIVPSNWLKNQLVSDCGLSSDHLIVIPYGINIHSFKKKMEKSADIQTGSKKKIIACVARLSPVKGHTDLLNALARLKVEENEWVCWLIGDGPSRSELELQRNTLKLNDHVLFLGDRNDVPALLKQADIFVLPSIQDNLPYAVMEAQVSGTPVIVTDAGGIPEMVLHEKTGLISSAGQSDSIYINLKRLLNDASLREILAKTAKECGEIQWSLDTMMKRTLTVYGKTIEHTKGENALSDSSNQERKESRDTDNKDGKFSIDSLFSFQAVETSQVPVDSEVWGKILSALPEEYSIPDPRFIDMIKQHPIKNYDRIS
ncbi:glycosyltransferase family 4 protein [Effusibacillus consociatus]|uniref:Glycosyltransferase family 4 protein n=1 Tax=Effusibacillus consociatus TaxID=1117041 RepID=A0ABV9Q4W6_9BACL